MTPVHKILIFVVLAFFSFPAGSADKSLSSGLLKQLLMNFVSRFVFVFCRESFLKVYFRTLGIDGEQ